MQHGNSGHQWGDFAGQRHGVDGDDVGDGVGLQQDDIRGRLQTAQVEPLLNPTHFGRDFSFAIQCGWASGNDRNGIDSIQEIVASSFSSTLERINFSISEAVAWGQYQEEWSYRLLRTQEHDQIKSLFNSSVSLKKLHCCIGSIQRPIFRPRYIYPIQWAFFYFCISPKSQWCILLLLLDDLVVKFMQLNSHPIQPAVSINTVTYQSST